MAQSSVPSELSADEALARLVAGNERFLRGESRMTAVPRESLTRLSHGQQPFATILMQRLPRGAGMDFRRGPG
jgi:hypothetical protein